MKKECNEWYSSVVYDTLDSINSLPAYLQMAFMKPLGAQWPLKAYKHLIINKEIILNGFKATGNMDPLKDQRTLQ